MYSKEKGATTEMVTPHTMKHYALWFLFQGWNP